MVVGKRWYLQFLKRQPSLTIKFSRQLNQTRSVTFTKSMLHSWFDLFRQTCERYSITLDQIWNMDETGLQMGVVGRSMVVVPRADGKRWMQQPGNTNWVSVLETIRGLGRVIEPFLVFKGVSHQLRWHPRQAPAK